jgi:phosphonoacetaldehyde hydrolase
MIRLVIFDWAGTTVDFGSCAPAGAFVEAFARMGVPVTMPEARAPIGLHKKEHLRIMLHEPVLGKRWQEQRGKPWTEADIDELYRLVTPLQIEAATKHSDLTPGLLETVATLREQGVKIGATTGYFREAAKACADAAAKKGYVPDFSICADDVPAGRPAPWMIFRVMEALNVYPPSAVAKVGDTVVDIEDGLNAGVWSLGVVDSSNVMGLSAAEFAALSETERNDRREQVREVFRKAGAHGTVDNLNELPSFVSLSPRGRGPG